jgi:hypothetical protein
LAQEDVVSRYCECGGDKLTFRNRHFLGASDVDFTVYLMIKDLEQINPQWRTPPDHKCIRLVEQAMAAKKVEWVPIDPQRPPRGYGGQK